MAVKKVKDDEGNEFEIEIDDDDEGPFIDEGDLRELFDKWLGERESSNKSTQNPPTTKKGAIRIKSSQKAPPKQDQQKPRRLRLA